ncbi:hypothetical protein [Massilia sp.]|uniref:hypothetical protein n=1 Tax=Massilia sp. TaxID=1882437 RepID=UPI00391C5C21
MKSGQATREDTMIVRMSVIGILLAAALAACARQAQSSMDGKTRLHSVFGFSFLPPPGQNWTAEATDTRITYHKRTDPRQLTFYTLVLAASCTPSIPGEEARLAFVRERKDQWGSDGRFTPVFSSFVPDPAQAACVRYHMRVKDHGARNLGTHPFLLLDVVGRYCPLPQHPAVAVDIVYSIRHVPGYDAARYQAEGEAFLDSLALDLRPADAGIAVGAAQPCDAQ